MTNVIDFHAKREQHTKKNIQFIPIGTVESTFDVVYDIDYDKFFKMFKIEEPK
jgi:hypothetical protein